MKELFTTQLEGTWLLVSMKIIHSNGETTDMYGENPRGISFFDNNGYMSAHMGAGQRNEFRTDSVYSGTSEEYAAAFKSYLSFYGRYSEKEPGILEVQIEDCLFPNWKGKVIIRNADIKDGILTLSTPKAETKTDNFYVKAIWRKI